MDVRVLLTVFSFIIFTSAWAQETIKKTFQNEYPPYKESYYVLKDNPEIKQGAYKRSYRGFSIKGQYDNGKRVGIWEFTGHDGALVQKIDFTNNIVTNVQPGDLGTKYLIKDGDTFREIKPDEVPVFHGGVSWFSYYLWTLLRYPAEARRYDIQGQVFLSVTITKDGRMIDEKVEEGPGYGTNEEALRVIKLIPDDWIPAKMNGEAVEIRVVIPVTFKMG